VTASSVAVSTGLLIALPLLIVFGGLLASADAVFQSLIENLFDWDIDAILSHGFTIGVWSWLVAGFLRQTFLTKDIVAPTSTSTSFSLGAVEIGTALGTLNLLFFAFVLYFIGIAQAGRKPFLRRIPGIDAIEEAIGRATELGRPVLYVPGILDIDDIQTIAGLVILENVAQMTARYETPVRVPVSYPIPFAIAEEMVKSGYLNAGRPDAYDPDSVQFVSPEQFAYVAAVTGIMLRDRPGAHIFMGAFYAESLMLAETGFQTGAIQVAGTANVHQLPFFVVACDYTLIGEEYYAASALLSNDPMLLGSLKSSDTVKIVLIIVVVVGCILASSGFTAFGDWWSTTQ